MFDKTKTYQLGFGGVDPPYPEHGSLKVEHKVFGHHASWRLIVFVDAEGHFEVLVASTKRWLVEAAYEAAKGRPLSELAEKFDELSTSDLPSAKDGGNT